MSPANAFANAFAGRCAAAAMTGDGAGPDPADEGEVVYTVERIVRSFTRNGERFYMVKWRGWSSRDNTVELEDQLVAMAQSGKIIWRGLPLSLGVILTVKAQCQCLHRRLRLPCAVAS